MALTFAEERTVSTLEVQYEVITSQEIDRINHTYSELPANYKEANPPFCVDGRFGGITLLPELTGVNQAQELYPQALGGSINMAVAEYFRNGLKMGFSDQLNSTFQGLRNHGFALGVHTDEHSQRSTENAGCGFADNLPKIIRLLGNETTAPVIFDAVEAMFPEFGNYNYRSHIQDTAAQITQENDLPNGETIINRATEIKSVEGEAIVSTQELGGDHSEKYVFINEVTETTLDVATVHDDLNTPAAFNLDLWYVEEQARALAVGSQNTEDFVNYAKYLTLALYVATEMILSQKYDLETNTSIFEPLEVVVRRQDGSLDRYRTPQFIEVPFVL